MNVGWYEVRLEGDPGTTLCRILWVIAMNYMFVSTLISYVDISMHFVTAHWLSRVAVSVGYSSLWFSGFSLQLLHLLLSTDSRCMGFSSCATQI